MTRNLFLLLCVASVLLLAAPSFASAGDAAAGDQPLDLAPSSVQPLFTEDLGTAVFQAGIDPGGAGTNMTGCACWPACVCDAECRYGGPGGYLCACYANTGAQCCITCNEWVTCGCV